MRKAYVLHNSDSAENIILIHKESNCFTAEHLGPQAERINQLFGSRILPTSFSHHAKPFEVQAEIRRLNPGTTVYLCDCTMGGKQ